MSIKHKLPVFGIHFLPLTCLTLVSLVVGGCSSESPESLVQTTAASEGHGDHANHEDHEDHEEEDSHPRTYGEAVEAVVGVNDTIKKAFAAKDDDAAHGPLHEIGHVLEDLNGLAEEAAMTEDQRQSVKAAVAKLFDAFGAVDATMHGKEGKSYDEVSMQIEENLQILKDASASTEG